SPDVTRLRVTVSGTLPEFLQPSPGRYKDPWLSQRQGDRYESSSVLPTPQLQYDEELGPGLLLLPLYCLLIRRAGAQIDAALPLALERVVHAYPHAADLVQFDLTEFAILERAQPLMVSAAGDNVARVQGHDHAGELDQLWHAVLHVIGNVIVIQVHVVPAPHPQSIGILDLIGGGNAWPDGRKGVEALAHPTPLAPGAAAFGTGRDVDDAGEAKYRLAPVG